MIDFNMKGLVEKHGTWVRVQVEFYDFLFETASELCAKHFREEATQEFLSGGFADTNEFYEVTIGKLEGLFATPEQAWLQFLEVELG